MEYIYIEIAKKDIAFLDGIIESYEGIAVLRTINAQKGVVELSVPSYFFGDVVSILKDLSINWCKIKILESFPMNAKECVIGWGDKGVQD